MPYIISTDQARATLKKDGYQEFFRILISRNGKSKIVANAIII